MTNIINNIDNGRTQTFTYDPLNRISSTSSQATSGVDCWGQGFAPDSLGNLDSITSTQCNSTMLNLGVDANNHINNSGFGYDAAGDMTQDGTSGVTYYFDAENRMYKVAGITGGPYCYFYDGNGVRVAKESGASSNCTGGSFVKLYWRSVSGDSLAETDGTGNTTNAAYTEYVFFSGRHIASRNGTGAIFYYFADQVGNIRTITTGNGPGQTPGQLCYDSDFTPYGLEIQHTERLQAAACLPNYKFTGYERDSETGLDYAFARYYSSSLNRFYSTDPLGGSIGSLQSHNAYAYTLNNPVNSTDPSGQWTCPPGYSSACNQIMAGRWAGFGLNSWGILSDTWNEFSLLQLPTFQFSGYYYQVQAGLIPYIAFLMPEQFDISSTVSSDLANLPIYTLVPSFILIGSGPPQPPYPPYPHGPNIPTPSEAATQYCEDHGQLSGTLPGTDLPVTASMSATAGPANYNTKNEITPVIPAIPWPEWLSFGAGVDIGINVPKGSAPSWSIGLGKNLGVSFYPDARGNTTGMSMNIGLSVGPPVTVSPGTANACGLRAQGE